MADFTIDQLFSAPTAAAFRAQMVTALVAMNIPADKWRAGGVASTMLTVASMSLALMAATLSVIIRGFFLPTATGGGLKLLALYVYGVTVPSATFATGNIALTNSGGGIYIKAAGEVTVQNPDTGVTYTNSVGFTLNGSSSLEVAFTATIEGSAGNANPGTITTLVTNMLGVSVTNAAAFVGVDAPSDEDIRLLCQNKLGAMSVRGPRTAYAYAIQVAVNAVTGATVNINRWVVTADSHIGVVYVTVAAPSGSVDPNDLLGVGTSIEEIARPEAVTVVLNQATIVDYTPTVTAWVQAPTGVTAAQVQTAIASAITAYLSTYPIGGVTALDDANPTTNFTGLFASGIYGAAAAGAATLQARLYSLKGATDLALASTEVASDGVSVAVNLIAPVAGVVTL
jgi:hypothetical protein